MNLKKLLAGGLSAAMLLSCAACSSSSADGDSAAADTAADAGSEELMTAPVDLCTDLFGVSGDTVIATVDGHDVFMNDLGYWIYSNTYYIASNYFGASVDQVDWTQEIEEGRTLGAYMVEVSLDNYCYYLAFEEKAEELGISLTEEDEAEIAAVFEDTAESIGSSLWDEAVEDGTVSEDSFTLEEKEAWEAEHGADYVYRTLSLWGTTPDYYMNTYYRQMMLGEQVEDYYFGEDGSITVTDEDLADYVEENGFVSTSGILYMYNADDTDQTTAFSSMTDEEKETLKAEAQADLDALLAAEDPTEMFEDLQANRNNDTGSQSAGAEYTYAEGTMVDEYYNATLDCEIGEIYPELVETSYGYFIIRRNAVDYDAIPAEYSSYASDDSYSLRNLYTDSVRDEIEDSWVDAMTVEYTDAYAQINMADYGTNYVAQYYVLFPTDEEEAEEAEEETVIEDSVTE